MKHKNDIIKQCDGQSLIEYSLLISLVALFLIASVYIFGDALSELIIYNGVEISNGF
jgi:Flp pilus assembly pilin Flp